jgi:outer membrane protein OmpA-like peptidoglycan-associated protein
MIEAKTRSSSTATTMAPERRDEPKTILLVAGALMLLVAVAGVFVWTSVESEEPAKPATSTPRITPTALGTPSVTPTPTAMHADIYFDSKSTRLRADAVGVLQHHAKLLTTEAGPWTVIVVGHADRQGPVNYNLKLAERRAESVKRFLVELGVPDDAVKVVAIGQDASICDDPTPACQQLNRRVHLEMRQRPVTAAPVTTPADAIVER